MHTLQLAATAAVIAVLSHLFLFESVWAAFVVYATWVCLLIWAANAAKGAFAGKRFIPLDALVRLTVFAPFLLIGHLGARIILATIPITLSLRITLRRLCDRFASKTPPD